MKNKRKATPKLIEASKRAAVVKSSGFRTSVHANPHKDEIDELILKYHWSSEEIVKYLKSKYPNETFPHPKTIDNYRRRYLAEEHIKTFRTIRDVDKLIEDILNKFNPAMEAIELWEDSKTTLKKSLQIMEQTGIPPRFLFDAFKTSLATFQNVLDVMYRLGLIGKGEEIIHNPTLQMFNVVLNDNEKKILISALEKNVKQLPDNEIRN